MTATRLLITVLLTLTACSASAVVVPPDFRMRVHVPGSMSMTIDQPGQLNLSASGGGVWSTTSDDLGSNGLGPAGDWFYTWDIDVDPDPFIEGSFSITNMSAAPRDFVIALLLPVSPSLGGTLLHAGSMTAAISSPDASGSFHVLGDAYVNGTFADPANPLADGALSLFLLDATVPCASGGGAGCAGLVSSSVATAPYGGPQPVDTLGIRIAIFGLTAGDTATITARYAVAPVPVPPAFVLLASSLGGFVLVSRRRSATRA